MVKVFIDFETYVEPPRNGNGYNLKNLPIPTYIADPKFQIHCAAIAINDEKPQIYYGEQLDEKLDEIRQIDELTVIAHNYNFDGAILYYKYGIVPLQAACTLSMFRAAGYTDYTKSAELKDCAKFFNFPEKIEGIVVKTNSKRTDELQADTVLWNALCEYCVRDTEICQQLYKKLLPEFTPTELDFQSMVLKAATQPRTRIDAEKLKLAIEAKTAENTAIMEKAATYWDSVDSKFYRSRLNQQKLMEVYNLPCFDKTARLTAMANNPNDKALASYCNVLSSIQEPALPTFNKLMTLSTVEPGVPLPIRISGAHTHRMSGTGGINFQNLPRGTGGTTAGARACIIPMTERLAFVGADSSQIEARVAAWIADDEECLKVIRDGIDVHTDMAVKMYDIGTYEEAMKKLKEGDLEVKQCRQIAKSANFGAQYGMGAPKFREYCFKNGIVISSKAAKEAIDKFRKARAPLTHFWYRTAVLMLACLANKQNMQVGHFYVEGTKERIILPDGQKMYYPNTKFSKGQFYVGKTPIWGGTILENLTQASATSIMKLQLRNLPPIMKDNFVLNVHDAWIYSIPIDRAEACKNMLIEALSTSPECCPNVPFKAEGEVAQCLCH